MLTNPSLKNKKSKELMVGEHVSVFTPVIFFYIFDTYNGPHI